MCPYEAPLVFLKVVPFQNKHMMERINSKPLVSLSHAAWCHLIYHLFQVIFLYLSGQDHKSGLSFSRFDRPLGAEHRRPSEPNHAF